MFLEKRIASFRGMYVVAVERLDQRVPWQLEPLFHRRDALVSVDQRVLGGRDLGIGDYFGIDDQIGAVLGILHDEGRDRKSVVWGKRVSVSVELGGRSINKKKN